MEEINNIKMYSCKVCNRKYVSQERAEGCNAFSKVNKDWMCRSERGRY